VSDTAALAHTLLTALFGTATAGYLVLAVRPRLGWDLTRWRYRDPAAVEPSRAVFALRRARSVVLCCVMAAAAVALGTARAEFVGALSALSAL
jgi:hypothetical protein